MGCLLLLLASLTVAILLLTLQARADDSAVGSGPARQVFVRGVDLSGSLMPKIFPEEGSERVPRTRGVVPTGEELVLKGKLAEVSVPPLHVRFGGLLRNWHYSPLQPARPVDTLKPWTRTRREL